MPLMEPSLSVILDSNSNSKPQHENVPIHRALYERPFHFCRVSWPICKVEKWLKNKKTEREGGTFGWIQRVTFLEATSRHHEPILSRFNNMSIDGLERRHWKEQVWNRREHFLRMCSVLVAVTPNACWRSAFFPTFCVWIKETRRCYTSRHRPPNAFFPST